VLIKNVNFQKKDVYFLEKLLELQEQENVYGKVLNQKKDLLLDKDFVVIIKN